MTLVPWIQSILTKTAPVAFCYLYLSADQKAKQTTLQRMKKYKQCLYCYGIKMIME